jgi:primosomal replication protein N
MHLPLWCNHRRHALKHIITKNKVMYERRRGMTRDHGSKCPRAEFMRQVKCSLQCAVLGHQWWNLPQE